MELYEDGDLHAYVRRPQSGEDQTHEEAPRQQDEVVRPGNAGGQRNGCQVPPIPDHRGERVIHTLSPLGVVGSLLASTILSKRHQKAELRKMANTA